LVSYYTSSSHFKQYLQIKTKVSEEKMKQKTLITSLLIGVFILSLSYSGFTQDKKFRLGAFGNFNLANTNEKTDELDREFGANFDRKLRSTVGAGGLIEYWINPTVAIQLKALYNQKGVKFEGTQVIPGLGIIDYNFIEKLEYLSVPLIGKVALGKGTTRPYVFLGPECAFLLSAELEVTAEAMIGAQVDTTINIKDDLKSTEIAVNVGAGIDFPISSLTGFLEASYGLGITKINQEGEESVRNNIIYLRFGIIL